MNAGPDWRLLVSARMGAIPENADGATNMATDAAILGAVCDGAGPTLRFYRWTRPTLSFGRNQPAAGRYDEAAAAGQGIEIVRRPTGGQAVLHADELTYGVVAPMSVLGRPRAAYRRINEALVAGLRRLGVPAEVAGRGPAGDGGPTATGGPAAGADWAAACFRSPAAGEVVVGGRKLVGSAQRCERRVILQHGSILLSGSQAAAEDLLLDGAGAGGPPAVEGWTTLEEVLGRRPAVSSLAGVLAEAFEGALGTSLAPAGLSEDESRRMNSLRERFASPDWTWRR